MAEVCDASPNPQLNILDILSKTAFFLIFLHNKLGQWLSFRQWSQESKNVLDLKLNQTYTVLIKLISFKQQFFPNLNFQKQNYIKFIYLLNFVMVTIP